MKKKLTYRFIDPNPKIQSTYDALLSICIKCSQKKAEAAIRSVALDYNLSKKNMDAKTND